MTEKRYVLYKHTSPNNIVYIGITCQYPYEKRWQRGRGYIYNKRFYNDIKFFGWNNFKHEILLDNLTLEDANKMEIEYIAKYRSTDKNFGYNILEGGNAVPKTIKKQKRKINKTIENKANIQTINAGGDILEKPYLNMSLKNMSGEKWVNLGSIGFSTYEVSNLGRVKSLATDTRKEMIRKQTLKNSYLYVGLTTENGSKRKTFVIHRLVAKMFIGENENTIEHLDGDNTNNRLENLVYVE